jgi:hypothetical protein
MAKNLAAGAAFSRDSRLQGAPAGPDQKFTSGEFRKQHEIAIASCNSRGEMDCRVVINATVGFTTGSVGAGQDLPRDHAEDTMGMAGCCLHRDGPLDAFGCHLFI